MAQSRIGGLILVKVNGEVFLAKGDYTYNLGVAKKEMVVGSDGVHGYKEVPQKPFIEGAITDTDELDLQVLQETKDATITLELANTKVIVLENAVYAADGDVTTGEGEIQARFEGLSAREVA